MNKQNKEMVEQKIIEALDKGVVIVVGGEEVILHEDRIYVVLDGISEEERMFMKSASDCYNHISETVFGRGMDDAIDELADGRVVFSYDNVKDDVCDFQYISSELEKVLPTLMDEYFEEHPEVLDLDEIEKVDKILADMGEVTEAVVKKIYDDKKNLGVTEI